MRIRSVTRRHRKGVRAATQHRRVHNKYLHNLKGNRLRFPAAISKRSTLHLNIGRHSVHNFREYNFHSNSRFQRNIAIVVSLHVVTVNANHTDVKQGTISRRLHTQENAPVIIVGRSSIGHIRYMAFHSVTRRTVRRNHRGSKGNGRPRRLHFLPRVRFRVSRRYLRRGIGPFRP